MNSHQEYFKYILGELIPEIKEEKIKIIGLNSSDYKNRKREDSSNELLRKLIFIRGGNSIDKLKLGNNRSFEVQVDIKKANQLYKELNDLKSKFQVLAHFIMSNMPAILFHPKYRALYLLFDFEKLVCKLSMLEDEQKKVKSQGRFQASFHSEESRWKIPVLDILGKIIRDTMGFAENGKKWGIVMTHDVDRIGVEPFLFFKNLLHLKKIKTFILSKEKDYIFRSFETLKNINQKYEIKPIWFFLSGNYSFRRYGNRYNSDSKKAKEILALVKIKNGTVGLHTSFYRAFNTNKCLEEKESLEKIYGQSIIINRNHYMRFDIKKSIAVYEYCGFKADSTIGYSDANGFRAGLCRPFHPWNYKTENISKILEVPLLFMDAVHKKDLAESWNDIKRVLHWIKKMRGCGTILFHPCLFAENQENRAFYESFIQESQRLNIPFLSIDDVLANRKGQKL